MQEDRFNRNNKMPPQASGAKFQRANTYTNKRGGYDTYGNAGDDEEEEEDYRSYMDAQKRDDPWRRAGTMRDNSGDRHSIGSDFDNDGNVKEEQPKPAESTDFFDMGDKSDQKGPSNNFNSGAGGFDFDFGNPAPQTQKPAQNAGSFDFFATDNNTNNTAQ